MQAKKAHGGVELQSHSFLNSALRWPSVVSFTDVLCFDADPRRRAVL